MIAAARLANMRLRCGRFSDARAILDETPPPEGALWPWLRAKSVWLMVRAKYLSAIGCLGEAECAAFDAHDLLVKRVGPAHRYTVDAAREVAAFHEWRGDSDAAASWRATLPPWTDVQAIASDAWLPVSTGDNRGESRVGGVRDCLGAITDRRASAPSIR